MPSLLGASHPNQVLYFDPGCATLNVGDEIISDSARRYLDSLFSDAFTVRLSTHQKTSFRYRRYLRNSRMGFILGSNLLKANMLFGFRQWDVSLLDAVQLRNLILVGCGWQNYSKEAGLYTRLLYKSILSNDYIHSVRDDYTKERLNAAGINNVVNTGCPTMWGFTSEFCAGIPTGRASAVVTTITDYRRDPTRDKMMLDQLTRLYDSVYVWLQGNGDYDYLKQLSISKNCVLVPPSLRAYDDLLEQREDIEYVGTRLHGGIRALQHSRRALIVSIDNRAREMGRDYGLPIIEREEIGSLTEKVRGHFKTVIRIRQDSIACFLDQFR